MKKLLIILLGMVLCHSVHAAKDPFVECISYQGNLEHFGKEHYTSPEHLKMMRFINKYFVQLERGAKSKLQPAHEQWVRAKGDWAIIWALNRGGGHQRDFIKEFCSFSEAEQELILTSLYLAQPNGILIQLWQDSNPFAAYKFSEVTLDDARKLVAKDLQLLTHCPHATFLKSFFSNQLRRLTQPSVAAAAA